MNTRAVRILDNTAQTTKRTRGRLQSPLLTGLIGLFLTLGCLDSTASASDRVAPSAEQLAAEARIQRQFATSAYLADLQRAEKITYALARAGAPYCVQRRKYSLGIPPLAIEDLPKDLREGFLDAEQASSDSNKFPRFLNIVSNSPAGTAGVKKGDILLQMTDRATGKQVPPGWTLNRPASTLVQNEVIEINVQRGSSKESLSTSPQLVCDVQLQFLRTSNLVARIDAGVLSLSQGILRFVANDDELAYLIANELIHEQLRLARSAKPGASARPSPADEEEADYLGAYLLVSARFDIGRGQNVWRRIASIPSGQSKDDLIVRHPLPPSRGVQIQAVSNEIRRKAQTGERQIPDRHFSLAFTGADLSATPAPALETTGNKDPAKEDPNLRVLTNIPYIDNEGIAGYQRFLDSPLRPRAFAIGPRKTGRGAWSFRFGTNAAADALTYCSTVARGPCYLYAVDDKVVWNPETALDQPHINSDRVATMPTAQPKGTGFAAIDDLTAVPLPADELPMYRAFLEKPSPRAFLITLEGKGMYWIGPAATHDALAYCVRLATPCWLYAVDKDVVWSKDEDKRISSTKQLPARNEESSFLEN